jgi:hypothetical protein
MSVSLLCVLFGHRFGEWGEIVLWLQSRECKRCGELDFRAADEKKEKTQ